MAKIRVLIADDHAVVRDGFRTLLGTEGDVEVVGEAATGTEAIEKTRELAPDVVLMDMMMPCLDGVQATRHLKEHLPQTRVLIVTQHASRQYADHCMQAGAAGFLSKAVAATDLISAVRSVYTETAFKTWGTSLDQAGHLRASGGTSCPR